ncbi:MAG TPA: protoporphyrinogen oxidase [Fimbriimonadaceae bacterium]|nr:protoporphyrinogen oxidase [Fimbriimonadaceae bacterium]
MKRVVVVGGGIAGLSAAYYLQKSPEMEVTLLEGSGRLGGKVGTERVGGYLIEQGPDSVFTAKPAAVELATELGMEDQFIEPQQHDFSILVNGRLFHVPRSLASLMPGAANALEKAEFLGVAAKRRILREKDAPKGDGGDESIASFFRRRFGRRFSNLLAEPLLAGIHGGDPEKLSMKALYPTYLGLEQKKGSLTGPSEQTPTAPQGRKAGFLSLRDGMESLVTTLRGRLDRVRLIHGAEANRIEKTLSGYRVYADGQIPLEADAIVLAVPAFVASCLLRDTAARASEKLLEIRHTSTAVVTLAFDSMAFPKELHGNGFLVPYTEDSEMTGCTWSSNKWEGRAPSDQILIRCFMGRDGGLDVDNFTDAQLVDKAASALKKILHAREAPIFVQVKRWSKAMPQKVVGHTELLAEIESALEGLPVYLIGASYRSSGIPDCVRDGRDVAERIA